MATPPPTLDLRKAVVRTLCRIVTICTQEDRLAMANMLIAGPITSELARLTGENATLREANRELASEALNRRRALAAEAELATLRAERDEMRERLTKAVAMLLDAKATAERSAEALRLASEVMRRDEAELATLKAAAARGAEERVRLREPERIGTSWPSGCIKPNACARHRACMYAPSAEKCRHFGQDLTAAVEAHL